ncbi:hypothetical protein K2Z83_26395 [Oscillochloris sp. ZM17-4]|uniref:hypothetical protein n=1 Tax=Oscillochloris sp. ZM17-4 TaxID=2866714 RepID=UPI001C729D3A|nr:hypothetical protein [Oscillochloris sp. ZM17-4]MBX0331184.1 hypothetical protein [Oscillochloris sp. ZM17-4]
MPQLPTPTITGEAWDLNERGKGALASRDQLAAAALFLAAIAADEAYYEPYNNLAFVRYEQWRDDEAIGLWRTALDLAPESADANAGLGAALAARGQIAEAWVYYSHALAHERGYADAVWMQEQRLWGPRAIMSSAPLRERAGAP